MTQERVQVLENPDVNKEKGAFPEGFEVLDGLVTDSGEKAGQTIAEELIHNPKIKIFAIFGEGGAGKSTLAKQIVNYLDGVRDINDQTLNFHLYGYGEAVAETLIKLRIPRHKLTPEQRSDISRLATRRIYELKTQLNSENEDDPERKKRNILLVHIPGIWNRGDSTRDILLADPEVFALMVALDYRNQQRALQVRDIVQEWSESTQKGLPTLLQKLLNSADVEVVLDEWLQDRSPEYVTNLIARIFNWTASKSISKGYDEYVTGMLRVLADRKPKKISDPTERAIIEDIRITRKIMARRSQYRNETILPYLDNLPIEVQLRIAQRVYFSRFLMNIPPKGVSFEAKRMVGVNIFIEGNKIHLYIGKQDAQEIENIEPLSNQSKTEGLF